MDSRLCGCAVNGEHLMVEILQVKFDLPELFCGGGFEEISLLGFDDIYRSVNLLIFLNRL